MSESPTKKHKKHKKHKHKRKRAEGEGDELEGDLSVDATPDDDVDVVSMGGQPSIKLKIKLGSHSSSSSSKKKKVAEEPEERSLPELKSEEVNWDDQLVKDGDIFTTKKAGDDTSDEEREWLNALEAGTLDDNGEVKKEIDDSLLTNRQKALIHGTGRGEEQLMQLPSGYKQPEFTEEQLQRRQQRAKKRKEAAFEKQEKDKKQTVDRLLKKQESKLKSARGKGSKRTQVPGYRYSSNSAGHFVCVPQGYQFPLHPQKAQLPPRITRCGADGCNNPKKYNCSKTGTPLCSLHCYKRNLHKRQSMGGIVISA